MNIGKIWSAAEDCLDKFQGGIQGEALEVVGLVKGMGVLVDILLFLFLGVGSKEKVVVVYHRMEDYSMTAVEGQEVETDTAWWRWVATSTAWGWTSSTM